MSGHKGFLIPRRILVIALAILAVGIIVSIRHMHTSGNAGYEYQRGRGDTINVAIAYSPMSLYRYADTLGGFNYEMLRDMGHMYGDKFKFYPVASVSESLDELSRGKYDILVADIPVTASLKERFRLSVPVYTDRMVLVSRDTTITSPLQLAGQSVWVVAGAPSVERLENLSREIGDSIDICDSHTYTAEQLVMLVAAGDTARGGQSCRGRKTVARIHRRENLNPHIVQPVSVMDNEQKHHSAGRLYRRPDRTLQTHARLSGSD